VCKAQASATHYPTLPTSSGAPRPVGGTASSADRGRQRFPAGTRLAQRYRIVELLGRGGMGEVYRADDLTLGQQVALKLLPEDTAHDQQWVERLREEVRLARQVSHPNVCRVHDIVEADGHLCISMEYIAGEDLASLLRRIGRPTGDKARDIGRQVSAGLAAAHAAGVFHRDLKPGNIMIDRQGRARITDFGLAVAGSRTGEVSEIVGTPAYMAPEQLRGEAPSERSDIYALGLVMYELYTGHRALQCESMQELVRVHRDGSIVPPADLVPGLDPIVEGLILQCMAPDPAERPPSALSVVTALVGGNPLQAHLEAGQTPSPQTVAGAPDEGTLQPRVAWACLLGIAAAVLVSWVLYERVSVVSSATMPTPPEVLMERARGLLRDIGHHGPPADEGYGLAYNRAYLRGFVARGAEELPGPQDHERTEAVQFWYRSSPVLLTTEKHRSFGRITPTDPDPLRPGMISAAFTSAGRLRRLVAVGSAQHQPGPVTDDPPWPTLFEASGLSLTDFAETQPSVMPALYADSTVAWVATTANGVVRAEGASHRGVPVYFEVFQPWQEVMPWPWSESARSAATFRVADLVGGFTLVLVLAAAVLARSNLRRGRGDRSGAFNVGLFFLVVHVVTWLLRASHESLFAAEWSSLTWTASRGLYWATSLWLFYIALEPLVRRFWPQSLVSWSRLLAGRYRDPMIARDLLIGTLFASAMGAATLVLFTLVPSHGVVQRSLFPMLGGRLYISAAVESLEDGLYQGLFLLFLLFLLRLALRRRRIVAVLFLGLTGLFLLGWMATFYGSYAVNLPMAAWLLVYAAVWALLLIRFGLLAAIVASTVAAMAQQQPVTADLSAWYSGYTLAGLSLIALIAAYGFRAALGGRQALSSVTQDG